MIELSDVSYAYGSGAVGLKNVSLSVGDGEFCFITGVSGSGKSTLSKLLTGELTAESGTVRVGIYQMGALTGQTAPQPQEAAQEGADTPVDRKPRPGYRGRRRVLVVSCPLSYPHSHTSGLPDLCRALASWGSSQCWHMGVSLRCFSL